MIDDTRYMILQYVIEVIKVLIPFLAVTLVTTTVLKLSIRAGLHSREVVRHRAQIDRL